MNIKNIHTRELGPYFVPEWLSNEMGYREKAIISCRTCCHFPHKLNRDIDEYISDNCITYSSKIHGTFTVDFLNRKIVG